MFKCDVIINTSIVEAVYYVELYGVLRPPNGHEKQNTHTEQDERIRKGVLLCKWR